MNIHAHWICVQNACLFLNTQLIRKQQQNTPRWINSQKYIWQNVAVCTYLEAFTLILFEVFFYFWSCAFYSNIGNLPAYSQDSAVSKAHLKILQLTFLWSILIYTWYKNILYHCFRTEDFTYRLKLNTLVFKYLFWVLYGLICIQCLQLHMF